MEENRLNEDGGCWSTHERVPGTKKGAKGSCRLKEEGDGLWKNIRDKRERGESPAKPGDEDYPDKKQWNKLTKEGEEMGETNNYMFWSNLKTIVHATGELMKMDYNKVDSILSDGHGWALDHMATANDDIEEVYHFLEGQINYEGADAEPMTEHEHESNNYMFWQNLKTMHHGAKEMLEMDSSRVDAILSDGHGWALDHVATSADDVEDVYHFIETEVDSYDGETQGGYSDEYGSVQNVTMNEAEYKGRTVKLGKPMKGDVKKFKVFVKNKSGKVVKVNFGDPNMEIKRDNPKRRKSFRARHKCSQAKDRTTPKYWSCRMWSKKPVSKIVEKDLSESKKSSIFDKNYFKMKMYESFNQEDVMNEPVTEPVVKPSPTRPAEQPVKQPSRKDKPFLPMPSTQPDPKAVNEAYDLVSQFTGDHHGSSMEKNEYLTSLGLDINGIKTLETWINLMIEDRNWRSQKYPQGGSFVEIIRDITKIVGNLKEFIKKYQSVNPIKVTNIIKDKLISSGKPNLNSIKEGKFDYETYHKTLSSALDAVRSYAINRGYDEVEFGMNDVQHVPYGHTERLHKELTKDGMPQRKSLNIQIYRMDGGNYELNMYIA
jgi:hypothetical protein